jgi:hypothetical protein
MDGDTPAPDRAWARAHATYLLTTPDMLHHSLLPRHARWDGFFRRLKFVIVDECHTYRGVFGSHVAQVLRRLRRITAHHAAFRGERTGPVFVLASATISEPETCARLLTGLDAVAVTADSAPRGPLTFGLWEPPLTALRGEAGAPVRRTATAEAAGMLADLVLGGVPALAFVRSRRGAEAIALGAAWPRPARPTWNPGSRPTGPVTCRRTGGPSRRRCWRAGSPAWPPRRRWSSASTSAASTRCWSLDGPGPGPPSGSRPGEPDAKAAARSRS